MLTKAEIDNLDRAEILIYEATESMKERGEPEENVNQIQDAILCTSNKFTYTLFRNSKW